MYLFITTFQLCTLFNLYFQGFVSSGYGVNGISHVCSLLIYFSNKLKLNAFFYFYYQNAGAAPSPLGQLPPNDGMPGGPMAPTFFPVSNDVLIIS